MNTIIGKEPVKNCEEGGQIVAIEYPVGRYSKGYGFVFSWLCDGTRYYQVLVLSCRVSSVYPHYLKAAARLYRRLKKQEVLPSYERFKQLAM